MVSKKETAVIRSFVVKQLRDESDLSTLTLGILKKRYLAHVNCESLSPEAKELIKRVVEEELVKMQENNESENDTEIKKPQNKRKREKQQEEMEDEEEKNKSRAKKSRAHVSSSSSDSEDDEDNKTESPKQIKSHSKNAKKEARKSDQRSTKNTKQQTTSDDDDSSDEEMNGSEKSENESNESSDEKLKKKANTPKNEETRNAKTSGGKETQESDKESEDDSDDKSEKNDKSNDSGSSDDEKGDEKKVLVQKKTESDSDSSSLPSLEDENKSGAEETKSKEKKKKMMKKDRSIQSQKDDDKAVVRLKRYISLCGVWKNYKKLLDGCRSTRSKVAVLKKELEDLGVNGTPSIDKCKKVRMKREEAQELADLDVANIITTQGRPKRRGISTRQDHQVPPTSTYQRALNSGSENEENNPDRGRKKMSEWANLRGIISDDADSD